MIEKINFKGMVNNSNKTDKNSKIVHNEQEDSFVKERNMNEEERIYYDEITSLLDNVDYPRMINDLKARGYWTDTMDFVGFNTDKNKKIVSVNVGNFVNDEGEEEYRTIPVDKFINIMIKVTADKIEKNPLKENEYKKLYVDIISHINKNRVKD